MRKNVTTVEEGRCASEILTGKPTGNGPLEDSGLDGRSIFEYILNE